MDLDSLQELVELDEARTRLVAAAGRLDAETVPVAELAGRVLAADAVAPNDLPTWANSALDGYAVRAAEAGGELPVAFAIAAGDDPPSLPPAAAAAIGTGGLVPAGADAVVPVERARRVGDRVAFDGRVAAGDGIRPAGADVRAGERVLVAGRRLTPMAAAALAAIGCEAVSCVRRPRALVLTTGDELVAPGGALRRGQIHDSNTTLVALALEAFGCTVDDGGRVPDTLAETEDVFRAARAYDLVVSTGGVSVGPRDHVKPAVQAVGATPLFWRVAIQPGKPIFAATHDRTLIVGLPGNPLSAVVGLYLLVQPAVAALSGSAPLAPRRARLATPVRRMARRLRVLPSELRDGEVRVLAEASHQVARAGEATALALVPAGAGELAAGAGVDVVPLEG